MNKYGRIHMGAMLFSIYAIGSTDMPAWFIYVFLFQILLFVLGSGEKEVLVEEVSWIGSFTVNGKYYVLTNGEVMAVPEDD